jgi:hypothetical protein
MRTSRSHFLVVALAFAATAGLAGAQETREAGGEVARRRAPFGIGERLIYNVRVGPLGRGTAVMEIAGTDVIRGRKVYRSTFKIDGSLLIFKVDDLYESWFDPTTMISMRYHQRIDQGTYERDRTYEIMADKGIYIEPDKREVATVDRPLDDGAFLYFLRTIPLEVGKTYSFNRYFKPDRNPVKVTVVRREKIIVPAGEFNAIVLQPSIKAKGIFAESAHAEVWVSDDDDRMMLQMKTRLPFGAVTFQLRSKTSSIVPR